MWLIVGLGNPGSKYLLTRHNVGFMAIDNFAQGCGSPPGKLEASALTCRLKLDDQDVLLVKPQTFMNLSGESVQELMHFYKIDADHILIVHDDVDQGFGGIKMHRNRGAGGHNGIKSISEKLGSQDYPRLKIGIGRPADSRIEVGTFVLQNFSQDEQMELSPLLNKVSDAIESFIFDGLEKAGSLHNTKAPAPGSHGGNR